MTKNRARPSSIVMVFYVMLVSGCATLPYQVEQRQFKEALSSGRYEQAKAKIDESLSLAPAEKKPGLKTYFTKSLFQQSWRDYKAKNWDKSFDLMTTAYQRATSELRGDWAKECQKIAHEYATFHLDRANAAIGSKDLKTAIAEYEAAAKADNNLGAEARAAFDKYTAQRKELEEKLETAKAQIEREQWNDGAATIEYVRAQDTSLDGQCHEISDLLTEHHYQAALRDCRAFFAKRDYSPAFLKASEALALNTTHTTEAAELKSQIQKAFAESASKQLNEALEKDARPVMEAVAKQYDAFELDSDASHIRTILVNRAEADRNLALAQQHIAGDRHESAIEPLRKACELWPENQQLSQLHKDTRVHVANDALSDADKALNAKYPLVCTVYCLKACTVSSEQEIHERAKTLSANAIAKVDRKAMDTAFVVDVSVNKEIETSLDAIRLQQTIIQGLPPPSRFVAVVPTGDRQPEVPTLITIAVDLQALTATTQERAYNEVVRYVSGVTYDPNPEYASLEAQLAASQNLMVAAQNDYDQAMRIRNQAVQNQRMAGKPSGLFGLVNVLGGVGGQLGGEAAQVKLSDANAQYAAIAERMRNTSPTVPRNIYSDYPYVVHQYERRGTLKAVVRMLGKGGKPIAERIITDKFHDSDTAHEGYGPAGLFEKPLELPTEEQIRERFLEKLFSEAKYASRDFVDAHWQNVLSSAHETKDLSARWERLLTLALQVPAMKEVATDDIRQNLLNIPADFIEQLESEFYNTGKYEGPT